MSVTAQRLGPAGRTVAAPQALTGADARWLYGFVAAQMACQLALVLLDVGSFRTVFRIGAFGLALAYLVLIPGRPQRHPAMGPIAIVFGIYVLQIFNPTTNTFLAGAAQTGLNLAIVAPLFWVPRLRLDAKVVRQVLLLFWVFHAASAGFGVLQVYFPGRFQPSVSTVILNQGDDYVESLQIELENGEQVFRPMGLTDVPGGAATSGFYTVLLGIGFFLFFGSPRLKALFTLSMALGMAAIYLSQVRVALVILAIGLASAGGILALRGYLKRFATLAAALLVVGGAGLWISYGVARTAVTSRLGTLVSAKPADVYHSNRGHFLETTFSEYLPKFPFGAGLGRWGMMNSYFGTQDDLQSSYLWVEIQWTGWIFDGGFPLALAYLAALAVVLRFGLRVALERRQGAGSELWLWATILSGYNLGTAALTFSYPIFVSQTGMEFWLLNAVLFTAAYASRSTIVSPERRQT